jgi:hypothetical protein
MRVDVTHWDKWTEDSAKNQDPEVIFICKGMSQTPELPEITYQQEPTNIENTDTFVSNVSLKDPDTRWEVTVSIFKHASSGGLFGVDTSFLQNTEEPVYDPFDGRRLTSEL